MNIFQNGRPVHLDFASLMQESKKLDRNTSFSKYLKPGHVDGIESLLVQKCNAALPGEHAVRIVDARCRIDTDGNTEFIILTCSTIDNLGNVFLTVDKRMSSRNSVMSESQTVSMLVNELILTDVSQMTERFLLTHDNLLCHLRIFSDGYSLLPMTVPKSEKILQIVECPGSIFLVTQLGNLYEIIPNYYSTGNTHPPHLMNIWRNDAEMARIKWRTMDDLFIEFRFDDVVKIQLFNTHDLAILEKRGNLFILRRVKCKSYFSLGNVADIQSNKIHLLALSRNNSLNFFDTNRGWITDSSSAYKLL